MPKTRIARILAPNPHVALSPRGIDQFAVYFEYVALNWHRNAVQDYCRVIVADNAVFSYRRDPSKSRTVWRKLGQRATPSEARAYALSVLNANPRNLLLGAPLLVQLEPTDLSQMASGQMPGVRYRGTAAYRALYGESDNLEDRLCNVPMSDKGVDGALTVMATAMAKVGAAEATTPESVAPAGPVAPTPPPFPGTPVAPSTSVGTIVGGRLAGTPMPGTAVSPPGSWGAPGDGVHDAIAEAVALAAEVVDDGIDYGDEPY